MAKPRRTHPISNALAVPVPSPEVVEQAWRLVNKGPHCWAWRGRRHRHRGVLSYGFMKVAGHQVLAHRLMFAITVRPLRAGEQTNHACNAVDCVRAGPGHVYQGSQLENMEDRARAGRSTGGSMPGECHHLAKLSNAAVLEIRALAAAGARHEDIARAFGVAAENVSMIALGKRWGHLQGPRTRRRSRKAPSALSIIMLRVKGLSWRQVAAALDAPFGTVKDALFRKQPPRASRRALAVPLDPDEPHSIIQLQPSALDLDTLADIVRRLGGLRPAA